MEVIGRQMPHELEWADALVGLMDDRFRIPGTGFRFGLDPLIGLIPVLGDIVSFLISGLIISALIRNGIPWRLVLPMSANAVLDLAVGAIPVAGDIWDFFNKANRRNLKLARAYFAAQ